MPAVAAVTAVAAVPTFAVPKRHNKSRYDLLKFLRNGEVVHHRLAKAGSTWSATYERERNLLVKASHLYKNLGVFEKAHMTECDTLGNVDGWKHCYVIREGREIPIRDLPRLA